MDKADFNLRISCFSSDYLISRKTQYLWNSFASLFFNVDVGVEQGSAFSPILSILYLSPIFHIFQEWTKNLNIPVSLLSFVNDGLIISQEKLFEKTNPFLYCSYNIMSSLQCCLIIEHGKSEIFHFSRSHGFFNPPSLNLSPIGEPIFHPKETWKYLGFIFDRKLSFWQHISYYSNKALSVMKMLGNSTRGLLPLQKQLLYRMCIMPIALYGFPLWFYNKAPLLFPLKELRKMQRRAAIWILGTFCTSPTKGNWSISRFNPHPLTP